MRDQSNPEGISANKPRTAPPGSPYCNKKLEHLQKQSRAAKFERVAQQYRKRVRIVALLEDIEQVDRALRVRGEEGIQLKS
jgi:hypothetical protein